VILLGAICLAAAAYQILALIACLSHLRRCDAPVTLRPGVSILKPVYGADDHFWPAIVSHARIQYPEFEILFGVRDSADSSVPFIERLQRDYPQVSIRIIWVRTEAPNAKVGSLIDLAREARHSVLIVNDSDIVVQRDYLDRLAGWFEDKRTGLVTCLYRAGADSFPCKWEALGIATDFAPSALVAPLVGVNEFGLGSTLAFRKSDLTLIGGFESVADYIADDYQLGKRISQSGKRVYVSRMPVETHLGAGTWKSVWDHQVRWARTIRLSRGAYLGLPITNASIWALLASLLGWWNIGVALLAIRITVGLLAGLAILHDPITARLWWLMPLRDLWGFAVWVAGLSSGAVIWRGKRITLDGSGRITDNR
jgi:ceramide glucosyltransferase